LEIYTANIQYIGKTELLQNKVIKQSDGPAVCFVGCAPTLGGDGAVFAISVHHKTIWKLQNFLFILHAIETTQKP